MHNVDRGADHFPSPGSLGGAHGTLPSFPTRRSSDLTLDQSLADPLTAGQIVHDHLVVTSFDGTATHDIDVTITGSNDNATITTWRSEERRVGKEGSEGRATADYNRKDSNLTDHDVDSEEQHCQTPASLAFFYNQ